MVRRFRGTAGGGGKPSGGRRSRGGRGSQAVARAPSVAAGRGMQLGLGWIDGGERKKRNIAYRFGVEDETLSVGS